MADTVVVFTRKTIDELLETGGSQYWKIAPPKARQMTYLVCCRNSKGSEGQEPHGAGFLIGRVSGVVSTEKPGRSLILIDEWARIDRPELWQFGRNPIHYLNLADLNIDPDTIAFEPMPEREKRTTIAHNGKRVSPLTIADAKQGLAMALGVGIDAIEITIRA